MPALAAGVSQSQLREIIRHKKHVEFALEGPRYFDLIRRGIAGQKPNGFVQNTQAPGCFPYPIN